MIKNYSFDYNIGQASAKISINTDVFTPKMAEDVLNFFLWDYDDEEDPIDEVAKKYGMEIIRVATFNNYTAYSVIQCFNNREGFYPLTPEFGITLISVESFQFDEDDLFMEVN